MTLASRQAMAATGAVVFAPTMAGNAADMRPQARASMGRGRASARQGVWAAAATASLPHASPKMRARLRCCPQSATARPRPDR